MDDNSLRRQYRQERDHRDAFTNKIHGLLEDIFLQCQIDVANIESRTKSIDSFIKKTQREGKEYSDPLTEITDISGIRIVAYYEEDVQKIGEIIETEFKVDSSNSIDKRKILDANEFGYLSIHYVMSLADSRTSLPEWKEFSNYGAEIQIRTVLQHAWASIDHKIRYKTLEEVPQPIRRRLFRLSALLEIADNEFSEIRDLAFEQRKEYQLDIDKGQLDLEINLESTDIYLQSSETVKFLFEKAESIGYKIIPSDSDMGMALLINAIKKVNIKYVKQLDNIIEKELNSDLQTLRYVKTNVKDSQRKLGFKPSTLLRLLVVQSMGKNAAKSSLKRDPFKKPINDVLIELLNSKN